MINNPLNRELTRLHLAEMLEAAENFRRHNRRQDEIVRESEMIHHQTPQRTLKVLDTKAIQLKQKRQSEPHKKAS